MPELRWKHHALIQALLSRGPLTAKEFYELFEGVTGRTLVANQAILNDYLLKINKELSYVQFELRACMNQYDGQLYYGVVNNVPTGSPSQAQAQTQTQVDGVYSIPTAFRNFTISQREKTLDELVKDQWLSCSPTGDKGLGVRSFLDLRSWFHSNEIPVCEFCNETGIKVEFCPNEGCNVRVHHYCLIKKFFSQRKASKTCPGCGNSWPYTQAPAAADVSPRKRCRNQSVDEPNNAGPSAADGLERKRRRNQSVDEPNNTEPSAADGSERKRRRNQSVDEPNNTEPSAADGPERKRRRNQSVDEPNNAGPSAADGLERKRRRNQSVDEPNHAGPSEPPDTKRQKKPTHDGSMNAGPSQVSEVASLRRSMRSASIHMR